VTISWTHVLVFLVSLFRSYFPTNNLQALLPIRATYLAHLILLDLVILIAVGEEYKLWRVSKATEVNNNVQPFLTNYKIRLLWDVTQYNLEYRDLGIHRNENFKLHSIVKD
jgi:hypothetical protein